MGLNFGSILEQHGDADVLILKTFAERERDSFVYQIEIKYNAAIVFIEHVLGHRALPFGLGSKRRILVT